MASIATNNIAVRIITCVSNEYSSIEAESLVLESSIDSYSLAEHLDLYDIWAARSHTIDPIKTMLVSYRVIRSAGSGINGDNGGTFDCTVPVIDVVGDQSYMLLQ